MITKLESVSYTYNCLSYCELGGELISSNKCLGDSSQIYQQMKRNNELNDRCIKNTFHIKIRIAPEDKGKLNIQDWINISNDYAKKIGYNDNMYAVYMHEEGTDREHIHVVASRIGKDNKAISNSYTHYKSMDFCRVIEKRYQLRSVKRVLEQIKEKGEFISEDKRLLVVKQKIISAINQSDSFEDFEFHLKNMGVKIKKGRGISFIDEDGVSFKGSKIDRKYSLKGIEKMFSYEEQIKQYKGIKM